MASKKVFVKQIHFNETAIRALRDEHIDSGDDEEKYFLNYPTVYIAIHTSKDKYSVYVGETANIYDRTIQHLLIDPKTRNDWKSIALATDSSLYIIGHEFFNKSLTLDIENRLMLYLSGVEVIEKIYNRRTNQQNDYYTAEHLDDIFSQIWRKLRTFDKDLFPIERIIKESSIFKASPFHKLSKEQANAISQIKNRILEILNTGSSSNLILVQGAAGAGKTVVLSSLFYDLFQEIEDEENQYYFSNLDNYLLVNHTEQLTIYQQIAKKLNLVSKDCNNVSKPTTFINNHSTENKVDVVLIDEAHLLWTQGKQSYRGKNQLKDIIDRAKVVVAVFDENQILQTNQIWEKSTKQRLIDKFNPTIIQLNNQMRINSSPETLKWIRDIIDYQKIGTIPEDPNYDIKIFEYPQQLEDAIREKATIEDKGISRITATFDWEYRPSKPEKQDYWFVREDDWQMPWNKQLVEIDNDQKRRNKLLSWAEQPHTINEVGSTYTVQGLDLNYAGVIIGPSVKYRNGRVIFDPKDSKNKNAVQKRTMEDGSKEEHGSKLIRNELNVLLTRGVNGLYVYAVDDELRNALLKADQRRK